MPETGKYFICATNPCLERMLDSQRIYRYLEVNEWKSAANIKEADLIIVSTCSLTVDEDESSLQYLRFCLKNKKDDARLVVAGCLPVIVPDKFRELGALPAVPPTELNRLDSFVNPRVPFDQVAEPNKINVPRFHNLFFKKSLWYREKIRRWSIRPAGAKEGKGSAPGPWLRKIFRQAGQLKAYIDPFLAGKRSELYYIRISRGCLGACSYCAKRFATGTLKSKPLETVVNEFSEGLRRGERLFLLASEDSGCYGFDCGTTITELLVNIFARGQGHDFQLAISNFNARWLVSASGELENIIAANKDKIYYLQVPIQSGSDRILELMNRQHSIGDAERSLERIRRIAPGLALKTDIIVGFPGENEEDFERTKEFMQKIKFEFADIFPYQKRPRTPASLMPDFVPAEIVERRIGELIAMQNSRAKPGTVFKKIFELGRDCLSVHNS